jgi:hypothetical protein
MEDPLLADYGPFWHIQRITNLIHFAKFASGLLKDFFYFYRGLSLGSPIGKRHDP